MWVIIISLTLVNSFSYLYTQILYFAPNCGYYKLSNIEAYNFWSIFDRMVIYCFWVIPIIVVFWPPDRTWYGSKISLRKGSSFTSYERNKSED